MQDLTAAHYARLGWEDGGSHAEKLNRATILALACGSGNAACNQRAAELFTAWVEDPTTYIPPDLRTPVYKYGMAAAGSAKVWKWWRSFPFFNLRAVLDLSQLFIFYYSLWFSVGCSFVSFCQILSRLDRFLMYIGLCSSLVDE